MYFCFNQKSDMLLASSHIRVCKPFIKVIYGKFPTRTCVLDRQLGVLRPQLISLYPTVILHSFIQSTVMFCLTLQTS